MQQLCDIRGSVVGNAPSDLIYNFQGVFKIDSKSLKEYNESLDLNNTMWANTVLAAGTATALVIYCGGETRIAMNSSEPREKVGELDLELNFLSKLLFFFMVVMAFIIVFLSGFPSDWEI